MSERIKWLTPLEQFRLLQLSVFLRHQVPSELMRMDTWMNKDRKEHYHKRATIECGTPACAGGWATAIFPELQFDWKNGEIQWISKGKIIYSGGAALTKFFGVDYVGSELLFGAHTSRSPNDEADIIDGYVFEHTKPLKLKNNIVKHY